MCSECKRRKQCEPPAEQERSMASPCCGGAQACVLSCVAVLRAAPAPAHTICRCAATPAHTIRRRAALRCCAVSCATCSHHLPARCPTCSHHCRCAAPLLTVHEGQAQQDGCDLEVGQEELFEDDHHEADAHDVLLRQAGGEKGGMVLRGNSNRRPAGCTQCTEMRQAAGIHAPTKLLP